MAIKLSITLEQKNRAQKLLMDIIAIIFVSGALIFFGWGSQCSRTSIEDFSSQQINLTFSNLIHYGLRTLFRLVIGIIFSIIFSICYAALAAKSKRAEKILMPLLDVLQSVPILGYMSFTVAGFVALAPGSALGLEMAAIFAIFTSQVWNITFSVYHNLKKVPQEFLEVASIYNFSSWRKFWHVEMPCAIPDMIWNSIISMSGAWFFVVAAESISYGGQEIKLPGVGSYISVALEQQDIKALIAAVITIIITIFIFDRVVFKILLIWSSKFCLDTDSQGARYWLYYALSNSTLVQILLRATRRIKGFIAKIKVPKFNALYPSQKLSFTICAKKIRSMFYLPEVYIDILWHMALFFISIGSLIYVLRSLSDHTSLNEIAHVTSLTLITLARLTVLLIISSIIWVPIGIYIGLRPKLRTIVQPAAQFLAAFPVNLFFPLVVICISKYNLNPDIWLSPLMIAGSQWYILFNVISGAWQIPVEFIQVSQIFQITGRLKYQKIILPAIMPQYLTGLIAATGGCWNASILAEAVSWGKTNIYAHGIGAYIAQATKMNNFPKIALGIMVMSTTIVIINKILWSKLTNYITHKYSSSN
jgi:NitT/TauT family transport system permease protein